MRKIVNAHDRFFRQSLADLKIAKDFFTIHLPRALLNNIDLDSLEICKESYIEQDLSETINDIVYKVKVDPGQQGYIYLALEHQSTANHFMAYRLLKYQLAIIGNHLHQYPKSKYLPLVLAMVYYHGKQTPYPEPTDFFELFTNQDLAREFFLRPFRLIDINQYSDEEIKTHKLVSLLELVQKHIYDRDFLLLLNQVKETIVKISTELEPKHLLGYLGNTLYYVMKQAEISDKIKFKEILEEIPLIKGGKIMSTMAEQWVQEGFKKGQTRGMQQGIRVSALNMLKAGMCCHEISKITGLSEEEVKSLETEHECGH